MVGQPKHLSDLAKIEADVRITCRWCGFEQDWARADLAAHLRAIGGSPVWSEITREMRCARFGCGSAELRALPVPYARRRANMPRRISRLDEQLASAAVQVLRRAAGDHSSGALATLELRVALLVAFAYSRDREATRLFWARAGNPRRTVTETMTEPLARIEAALERRGWLAPSISIEQPRIWPWQSLAPPGWVTPAWNSREEHSASRQQIDDREDSADEP